MNKAQETVKAEIAKIDYNTSICRRNCGFTTASDYTPWDKNSCEDQAIINLNTDEAYCGYKDLTDQESKDWMFLMAYAHVVLMRTIDLKNKEPDRMRLRVDIDGNVFDEEVRTLNKIEKNCYEHTLPF